jgi:hypothetical protein
MKTLTSPFPNILITAVENGPFFIDNLFRKKFASPAPEHGHSVVVFYRRSWHHFFPLSYTNFLPYEEVMLVGGAMTDGPAFGLVPAEEAEAIREAGGLFYHVLQYALETYKDQCEGFFALVEDQRSMAVNLAAGFQPTRHNHLIANFHKPISPDRKNFLIEKTHGIGPF